MMKSILLNNLNKTDKELVEKAIQVRKFAYCPYSGYAVGAALIDSNGRIHTGCNIESADYTLSSHAEMVAIDSMVKSGCLLVKKVVIALRGIGTKAATPCGLCRQKIVEFDSNAESEIIVVNLNDNNVIVNITSFEIKELLPFMFNNSFIK